MFNFLIYHNSLSVKGLNPHGEYEIRVVAVNSAGRGMPSATSASVQLRLDYDLHSDFSKHILLLVVIYDSDFMIQFFEVIGKGQHLVDLTYYYLILIELC